MAENASTPVATTKPPVVDKKLTENDVKAGVTTARYKEASIITNSKKKRNPLFYQSA